jgi:hypothetical protein
MSRAPANWITGTALALFLVLGAMPAQGQAALDLRLPEAAAGAALALVSDVATGPAPSETPATVLSLQPPSPVLTGLHVSFAALQVMDVYSTLRGFEGGLVEANPLLRHAGEHPLAIGAVKTAVGVSTILLTRRVARRHRALALFAMGAVNAAYTVVVSHNLRAVSRR